ncbi:MAG: hypothetical protein JWM49_2122 [Microbacteriaceae bacterium]|nr:hypothetical protein [Microbacteriaceae bacterium]
MLVLGLGAILTIGGIFVPATYLQPWSATYYQQFSDPRMQVVAHAVLAPNGHNMQPWTVQLDKTDPDILDLYTDPPYTAASLTTAKPRSTNDTPRGQTHRTPNNRRARNRALSAFNDRFRAEPDVADATRGKPASKKRNAPENSREPFISWQLFQQYLEQPLWSGCAPAARPSHRGHLTM